MKVVNKKKLIVRISQVLVILVAIILTPISIKYATILRGYKAVGGEYLLPMLALIVILIIETIYEESKNKINGGKRKCN